MVVESVKQRVLLIEESATLRYVLVKTLQKQAYEFIALDTFNAAYDALSNTNNLFNAVIIGWPNYKKHTEIARLLALMEDETHANTPVLVLSRDTDANVLSWMNHRRYTALIPWESYQESVNALQKLLSPKENINNKSLLYTSKTPMRILLVDDSPSIRHYYQQLLTRYGYLTETANTVDSAYELALQQPFDLAIIDYFMPCKYGSVLCQKLRDNPKTSKIRTAVITGTYLDEIIKDCLEAGAAECMFKNEGEELFLARIASMSRFIDVQNHIESEHKRLAGILESVGEGVYGVDNEGLVTFVNPAALSIVGKPEADNVIGEKAKSVFHYHKKDSTLGHDRLYRAYGNSIELRCWETSFKHESGNPVPIECTVYPLKINGEQEGSVIAFRDISERKMLEEKLHWQVTHDHLTRLNNRRYFEEQLSAEVHRVLNGHDMSALIYIDLDRFKYINDTAGHDAGDKLLLEVAKILLDKLRDNDLLARLGGDEFAIILRRIDKKIAQEVAESLRMALENCVFSYAGENYNINASLGVAMMDSPRMTSGDVLANADIACTIAKRSGRNQSHLYEQNSAEKGVMGIELDWSNRLREAMENNKFVLHFQPILDLSIIDLYELPVEDGAIWDDYLKCKDICIHYELLLRMQGDDGQLYFPDSFIPTAERFNLMCDVDMWVLNEALRLLVDIHRTRPNVSFSVNLSGQTINAEGSLNNIKLLLNDYSIEPHSLVFEVTETCAIVDFESANYFINEMRSMGYRFSLDDFGSGFCSFSQLKCLPADFVKIDGQFVKDMARGSTDRAIVTAMNDVAHSLGRYTVAEYVETAEILRLLKICGVDFVQGNYVSKPLPSID